MPQSIFSMLAFLPLLLAAVLLVGFNWPARRAMPLVFAVTVTIALVAWDMTVNRVVASALQGLILTGSILWIIFGAILLLNTLKYSGAITAIRRGFSGISSDRRASGDCGAAAGVFYRRRIGVWHAGGGSCAVVGGIGFPALAAVMADDGAIDAGIVWRGRRRSWSGLPVDWINRHYDQLIAQDSS